MGGMKGRTTIRDAGPADAVGVHALVLRAGTLEANSAYCYLLLCDHFRDTAVVAESEGEIIGVVVGYRPPTRPEVIFVWQVGVDPAHRGMGLGRALLSAFVRTRGAQGAEYLEATVAPSNAASRAVFGAFARAEGASVDERTGYPTSSFPDGHEAEPLLRIGPLHVTRDRDASANNPRSTP